MKLPTKKDIWKYGVLALVCLINIAEMFITEKYFFILHHGWILFTTTSVGQLYMMSLFPLFYGVFSRLLTRATVIPVVFFMPFLILYSICHGAGKGVLVFVLALSGIACAGSLIAAALDRFFGLRVQTYRKGTEPKSRET